MTEKRKLAAILAANVVGFSRLTGADEDRTLARLDRNKVRIKNERYLRSSIDRNQTHSKEERQ